MTEFDVTVGVGGSTAENRVVGVRVEHESGGWILQFRQDRFVLSAIGRYPGWNEFESMAMQHWAPYRSKLGETSFERIALRTINRIHVPANGEDMREYFRTYPEVSPDLPQSISGFLLRVSQVYANENCAANIMQTAIPPSEPDAIAIVVDVDLYQTKLIPDIEPALWNRFRQLHLKRNDIFEACITNKTRGLFDAAN